MSAPAQAAHAWAQVGRHAALKLQPQALEHYRRGWRQLRPGVDPGWTDDTLAWSVRAALRANPADPERWTLVQRSGSAGLARSAARTLQASVSSVQPGSTPGRSWRQPRR